MNKALESLWKIDHTICMNQNEKNIRWNIDRPEDYSEGGYDEHDTDCKSFEDFCDCYDNIESVLNAFNVAKKVFEYNSLASAHIDSALEEGWITQEERDLLFKHVRKGRYNK